jgi:hypothetical protein
MTSSSPRFLARKNSTKLLRRRKDEWAPERNLSRGTVEDEAERDNYVRDLQKKTKSVLHKEKALKYSEMRRWEDERRRKMEMP